MFVKAFPLNGKRGWRRYEISVEKMCVIDSTMIQPRILLDNSQNHMIYEEKEPSSIYWKL